MYKKIAKILYKYRIFYCLMNYLYNFYITSALFNPLAKNAKYLKGELDFFFDKIEKGEHFALIRSADGERAIMCQKAVIAQEKWESPNRETKLGRDILDSLDVEDSRYYYAISCPCCDEEAFFWYKSRIPNPNITFSNIWVNSNFARFKERFEKLQKDCILIANYRAQKLIDEGGKLANMRIIKHYSISDDCISFWENEAPTMIEKIKQDFGAQNDLLFIVSAGPMSAPLIKALFLHNPRNTYIDMGSAIDGYYREQATRPYQDKYSIFGSRNCFMPRLEVDVSVVLTLYKRGNLLDEQIEALKKQSIKPKEMLLFVDSTNSAESSAQNALTALSRDVLDSFDNIISVRNNVGVWGRFAGGLLAKSTFVCFFDDDTIPAHRWLENCFREHLRRVGLYGGIGIVSNNLSKYPFDSYYKVGWEQKPPFCVNNKKTQQVDFVGHSWFLKKDYLGAMWIDSSEFYRFKNVGEDAYLSFALKKYLNISTFVPPHKHKDFFSSTKGVEYGTQENAISQNMDNFHKMNQVLAKLHARGMREVSWSIKYQCIFLARHLVKKIFKNTDTLQKIKKHLN